MSIDAYGDAELAALYDLEHDAYDDDLPLYEGFAARGTLPSLELAAGSGRVALHLARGGHRVVALDASAAMLARLQARADAAAARLVRVVQGDMRSFDLGERFDLVYIALNSFEHLLTTEDAEAALGCIARHLSPGGVFVAELRSLASIDWAPGPGATRLEWALPEPESGDLVTKTVTTRPAQTTQTTAHTVVYDRTPAGGGPVRRRVVQVELRVFGLQEFRLLLERAELRLLHVYGGADLSPLTDASDTMVVVAGPAGG